MIMTVRLNEVYKPINNNFYAMVNYLNFDLTNPGSNPSHGASKIDPAPGRAKTFRIYSRLARFHHPNIGLRGRDR